MNEIPQIKLGPGQESVGRGAELIQEIADDQAPVLVFIPSTVELQRFVLSGALNGLAEDHRLEYVLPEQKADVMMAAAPEVLRPEVVYRLEVPIARFKMWAELFRAACFHHSDRSRSFALRIGPRFAFLSAWQRRSTPWPLFPPASRLLGRLQRKSALPAAWRKRLKRWHQDLKPYKEYAEGLRLKDPARYEAFRQERLRDLEPLAGIVELFDQTNPVYVLLPTSLLDPFCNDVLFAAERERVTTVVVQSGWDNLSSKGIVNFQPSITLVWGKQSRLHAREIQQIPRRIVEIGAAQYSALTSCEEERCQELRERLGVGPDEKLVLFGGSFRQFDETSTLRWLDKAISQGKVPPMKVVYRPHPWRATRTDEPHFFDREWDNIVFDPVMEDRYRRVKEDPRYLKREVPIYDMRYLADLLTTVDAVISPMSTLLVEALILGKPTLAIAFPDDKHEYNPSVTAEMTHFEILRDSKALMWCRSRKDFRKNISRLLKQDPNDRTFIRRRDAVLSQVVVTEPGIYSNRLKSISRRILDPRGRALRGQRTATKRAHMSHAYSAEVVAHEYCGLHSPLPTIRGYWMHGWLPQFHNVHPALIALHKKEGQDDGHDFLKQIEIEKWAVPQWVARQDQADYLRSEGYQRVRAIGLPVCYLPETPVERVPNSLLVMPPHGHRAHGPGDPLAERYADQIAALKDRFDHIRVSLNENDYRSREWLDAFEKRGIPAFVTADQGNPRTLERLRKVLSTFEYVTTNGYGSHIAYAALFGAKVSIYGDFADFPRDRMRRTHAIKMFPALLDEKTYLCGETAMRKHLPELFVEPDNAVTREEWGKAQVGWENRLPPAELARLFGWPSACPDRKSVSLAGARRPDPSNCREQILRRPRRVLLALRHAGFIRNYESLIRALVSRGFDIQVLLSSDHRKIVLGHYEALSAFNGSSVHFTVVPGKHNLDALRLRVLRDVLFYAHPRMRKARDLQARFSAHQKGVFTPAALARFRRASFLTTAAIRRRLDRRLAERDRAIPPPADVQLAIDSFAPDLVVVSPLVNFGSREVDIAKAAQLRGVPVLLPVASWDNLTNKGRLQVVPEQVAVWNKKMAKEAMALHGIPRNRVSLVGACVFDWWFEMRPESTYEEFTSRIGLDPNQITILYVCSSNSIASEHEELVIERWIQAVRQSSDPSVAKANLLIRPHPMAIQTWERLLGSDQPSRPFMDAVVWPLDVRHPTDQHHRQRFFDSLHHASAIVGLNTSVMMEAAIVRRPVFTFLDHAAERGQAGNLHFSYLAEAPFVTVSRSLAEHVAALSAVAATRAGLSDDVFDRFIDSTIRPRGRDRAVGEQLADLVESMTKETASDNEGSQDVQANRA